MRIPIVGAGLCWLALTACGHPVQRQLEGTWHGESVENFDDRDIPRATGWAKSLRFSFDGPRMTISIAAEEERTGKYRVRSVHNSDVVLAVARPDGTEDVARFKLDSDHSIRWVLGESRSIVLRREL
ncbi:MAG TPA: hypothetical protein VIM73_15910 [Polyangiaceae bacterium]